MPRCLTIAETGSTNADLLALVRDGTAQDGMWLRAERQSDGRGRHGRVWDSPAGNLYASTLVRLSPDDPPAATLALVAAVALEETVRQVLPEGRRKLLHLKWPNDLLLDGAKLSGILLERAGQWVVIGIGVNIAHHPVLPDRPATSLHAHGAAIVVDAFAERLAAMLAAWIVQWRGDGLGPVTQRWRERAHPAGTALIVRPAEGGELHGTFRTLSDDGALVLRLDGGEHRVIHAGDVFLV